MAAAIKVGILGSGMMGTMHSGSYATLKNVDVVAVAGDNRKKTEMVAQPHDAAVYRTWQQLLEEVETDVIDVCLPTFLHAEAAIAAMKRGRHVFCEKPMALNLADADRMIATAREYQVKLMIGHVLRFWPEYQALEQVRAKKKLGALRSFVAWRTGALPTWTYRNWIQDFSQSGGAALDLHIHDVDFVCHLFGPPQAVFAVGRGTPPGLLQIATTFIYDDKTMAFAEGSWHPAPSCPFEMGFSAGFEKGMAEFSSSREPTLYACPSKGERYFPSLPKARHQSVDSGGNISASLPYASELEYFLSCIRADKDPMRCMPEDSRTALRVALAALKSCETGKPVKC